MGRVGWKIGRREADRNLGDLFDPREVAIVDDAELEVEEFGLKSEREDWWSGSMYDADREGVDVDAEKRRSRKPDKMPVVGAEDS